MMADDTGLLRGLSPPVNASGRNQFRPEAEPTDHWLTARSLSLSQILVLLLDHLALELGEYDTPY